MFNSDICFRFVIDISEKALKNIFQHMAARKLNTQNPESLEYTNDILKQTVLGGIKLEGLDRMRVTHSVRSLKR